MMEYSYKALIKIYKENPQEFWHIVKFIPTPVYCNKRDTLNPTYISNNCFDILENEVEGWADNGYGYLENVYTVKSDYQLIKRKISEFEKRAGNEDTLRFFQNFTLQNNKQVNLVTDKLILDKNNYINFSYILPELGLLDRFLENAINMEVVDAQKLEQLKLLTQAEKRVLFLLSEGKTNAQIGNVLHISEHTVKSHRKSLKRKLSISNIRQIIDYGDILRFNGFELEL